jgi:hypothetical protein
VVTVNSVTVTASTGAVSVCVNATTALANTTAGGTWSSSNTAIATVGASTGVVTGVLAGSANIIYTVTASGCTAMTSHAITVNALPSATANAIPSTIYYGQTVTLTGATSGASPTFAWSHGATGNTATVTPTSASSTYTLSVTDANGCVNTDVKIITVRVPEVATGSAIGLAPTTTVGGWTYYTDPVSNNILFEVFWNGNTDAATMATIDVNVGSGPHVTTVGANTTATMNRHWNVNLNGAPLPNPTKVRFLFNPSEKAATLAAVSGTPNSTWFKTNSGIVFAPATHVTATGVINAYALTGVETMFAGTTVNYVEFDGIASFSGGTFAASSSTPLPITLSKFTGKKVNNEVQLAWVTQTEQNVARFEVERSADAQNFTSIGTKVAKGNSNVTSYYDLMDTRPLSGNNYYRLKTTDKDGSVSYSSIINVFFGKSFNADVRPNPVRNDLKIVTFADENMDINIRVFDMTGKEVMNVPMGINKNTDSNSIDVTQLLPGVYNIRFENVNHSLLENRKFVKVN